ncbi:hypothetical protein SDC9_124758 [bioreactor metagenome]|uniref:Beta-lactamase-related domain-containing protein n=1 Tax=bioreactor metagenome TaxID=1076179 RepID=A0A645CL71_9ZZZZ
MNQIKSDQLSAKVRSDYANITGLVVLKQGRTVYEQYFNACTAQSRIHLFSVTKSVLSILIGIALDQGYLSSLDQRVVSFFPDYPLRPRERTLPLITIRDLLTMTAPYRYRSAPYLKYFTSHDWVQFAFDQLGGHGTIGEFRYTPLIGPDLLSGILSQVTGQSVLAFANEHLFTPLQITVEKNITFANKEEQMAFYRATTISGWVADPQGINTAGWGLTLSTLDLAKLGQLYLSDGRWENRQLVSAAWVRTSTAQHSCWEAMDLPYGYLWWVGKAPKDSFAAIGDGGNVLYVNRKTGIVVAMTALFKPRITDRLTFIEQELEPLLADVE